MTLLDLTHLPHQIRGLLTRFTSDLRITDDGRAVRSIIQIRAARLEALLKPRLILGITYVGRMAATLSFVPYPREWLKTTQSSAWPFKRVPIRLVTELKSRKEVTEHPGMSHSIGRSVDFYVI